MVFRPIGSIAADVIRRAELVRAAAESGAPEGDSGDRPDGEGNSTDRSPMRTRVLEDRPAQTELEKDGTTGPAKSVRTTLANAVFLSADKCMDRAIPTRRPNAARFIHLLADNDNHSTGSIVGAGS